MPPRSLTYYDPPVSLQRHVLVLFHFSAQEPRIEDRQPGGLGQMLLFARGEGAVKFARKEDGRSRGIIHLISGFSAATPFVVRGPWEVIGASLSPLGWAALTRSAASAHVDRFFPAEELLGAEAEEFAQALAGQVCAGELSPEAACTALGEWIGDRLATIPRAHEKLIERTIAWLCSELHPDLDALFPTLTYSRRQAERLVERYFGFPPAALARKFRAIRSAALLSQDRLAPEEEAALAEAFYDQPHMVREIRRYCGYTPSRLGGEGQPIMKTLLQLKNFDRLQEFRAG